LKNQKYGEGPDFSRKYTTAVRAVVGRVSDGVRTTVSTDLRKAANFCEFSFLPPSKTGPEAGQYLFPTGSMYGL